MTFPNHRGKHSEKALFEPQDFIGYVRKLGRYPTAKPPEGIILCYSDSLIDYVLKNHKVTTVKAFGELHLLDDTEGKVGIAKVYGVGGPCAALTLEEKAAFGVRKFLSIGYAGSIQKDIGIGDVLVCDRAIRDEGASHHYLPSSKYAHASAGLTARIKDALEAMGVEYRVGTSWTTDAVYRETVAEVRRYQKEAVAAVEMEAATLFAVAEFRNLEIGCILTISDSLANLKWQPEFHSDAARAGLETLFKAAVLALSDG
jgi:uridine phosphorylase